MGERPTRFEGTIRVFARATYGREVFFSRNGRIDRVIGIEEAEAKNCSGQGVVEMKDFYTIQSNRTFQSEEPIGQTQLCPTIYKNVTKQTQN